MRGAFTPGWWCESLRDSLHRLSWRGETPPHTPPPRRCAPRRAAFRVSPQAVNSRWWIAGRTPCGFCHRLLTAGNAPPEFRSPAGSDAGRRPALLGSEPLVSRILFPGAVARGGVTVMHLARRLPDGSSDLPGSSDRRPSGASLFGLAPCGVYRALDIAAQAVRSYRTFSPLPLPGGRGGLFSVALSFRSPGLGVTQRTALRSSDFPPAPEGAGDRLNDSNRAEF